MVYSVDFRWQIVSLIHIYNLDVEFISESFGPNPIFGPSKMASKPWQSTNPRRYIGGIFVPQQMVHPTPSMCQPPIRYSMSKTSTRQLKQPLHPLQVHHHRHKTHKSSWCCIESFYMLLTQRNAVEGTFWTKKKKVVFFATNAINKLTCETNQTSKILFEESIIGKATKHTVVMGI